MSAAGMVPARGASLRRLTGVELRKAVDTRSGRWLLLAIALACLGVSLLQMLTEPDVLMRSVRGVFTAAHGIAFLFCPILGILLVTAEWAHRTSLTTYALVPRRHRITAAKGAAVSIVALGASAVSLGLAVTLNTLAPLWSDAGGRWDLGVGLIAQVTLIGVVSALGGLGFGLALMNAPLAITLYFALPTALTVVASTVRILRAPLLWLDINRTLPELYLPHVTGAEWSRAAVSVLAWVVLPLAIGTLRTARREVA